MLPTMVNTYRKYVGRSLHRREDEHFLRGEGTYVANLESHDAICMAVVRAGSRLGPGLQPQRISPKVAKMEWGEE